MNRRARIPAARVGQQMLWGDGERRHLLIAFPIIALWLPTRM